VKILICGSRDWVDVYPLMRELRKFPTETTIIHGACRGADRLGGEVAMGLGFLEVIAVPANWAKYKRGAGPVRNRKMLRMLDRGDRVIAFHEDISKSKGTAHMVHIAREAGFDVDVFDA
jgi:hypothetical protein